MTDQDMEWFTPTASRVPVALAALVTLLIGVPLVSDGIQGGDVPLLGGTLTLLALAWVTMARPRVGTSPDQLAVRGPFSLTTAPLAGVEKVVIRQVFAARVGGRRVVSSSLGRSRRQMAKETEPDPTTNHADFVQTRLDQRMADARERAGVDHYSDEQEALGRAGVRHSWAPLPIVLVAVPALVTLLGLVF